MTSRTSLITTLVHNNTPIPLCSFKPDIAAITAQLEPENAVYTISTNKAIAARVVSAKLFQALIDTCLEQEATMPEIIRPLRNLSMDQILPVSVFKQQISKRLKDLRQTSHWVITQNGKPHFVVIHPTLLDKLVAHATWLNNTKPTDAA